MNYQIENELGQSNFYKRRSIYYLIIIFASLILALYLFFKLNETTSKLKMANYGLMELNGNLEALTAKQDSLFLRISEIENLNSDTDFLLSAREYIKKYNNILVSAKSSSKLNPLSTNTYDAHNGIDGKARTAWCEGVNGDGIGENLTIMLNKETAIQGMRIMNGYNKFENNIDTFSQNARIKKAKLVFSDGTIETIHLDDVSGFQKIEFNKTKLTRFVKIIIEEVYKAKYEDTCVSEVEFIFSIG